MTRNRNKNEGNKWNYEDKVLQLGSSIGMDMLFLLKDRRELYIHLLESRWNPRKRIVFAYINN